MNSFDLIPEDYHQMLWFRAAATYCAISMGVLLIVMFVGFAVLHYLAEDKNDKIQQMQSVKHISEQQRNELTRLVIQQAKLQSNLDFLEGLRGGVTAPDMFVSVDRAIPGSGVWFRSWDFQRAGFEVAAEEQVRSNGYFIVLPKETDADPGEVWKIETHMNVRGHASDHAALARFVSQLFRQPEVNDVRILDTTLAPDGRLVDFNLVITVNNSAGVPS